ncbi:hypothetical protein QMT40_002995 [Parvibaculaceae bacterium PLY_AMNH_Bact1]|nr:hypothetical protein QMT40_002995 [Parvibaculaceae bacterium PLY_AMNH_Bact1]
MSDLIPSFEHDEVLPEELPRGSDIPDDLDPFADGILMQHQKDWLADTSTLKLAEKGRRTGITFAEALDDTLIAATKRTEGGDNVFYIGDTKDKGREFIGYVAHFAKVVSGELGEIEEFVFKEQREDGSANEISAYRVRFASGFRVEALSSRPENIRGLQGVVVIDEAAFHIDVRGVLDAVNALLIWGGKIRVISTHNGVKNPFNELIADAKSGEPPFSLHFIPFQTAVDNGLYERVCLVRGWEATDEGKQEWLDLIVGAYGTRDVARKQELECIPGEGDGSFLTRIQIESCMIDGIPIIRWAVPEEVATAPLKIRAAFTRDWCNTNLLSILQDFDPALWSYFGEDFGRHGDMTSIVGGQILTNLTRRSRFVLELRKAPYAMQKIILFYIIRGMPRFLAGAMDATGNGEYLAETANENFGEAIHQVKLNQAWYRANMEPYRSAFDDKSVQLPNDADILSDHQAIQVVGGVAKVPDGYSGKGADGYDRHGDTGIAGALAYYASRQDPKVIDFQSSGQTRASVPAFGEVPSAERTSTGFGTVAGRNNMDGF